MSIRQLHRWPGQKPSCIQPPFRKVIMLFYMRSPTKHNVHIRMQSNICLIVMMLAGDMHKTSKLQGQLAFSRFLHLLRHGRVTFRANGLLLSPRKMNGKGSSESVLFHSFFLVTEEEQFLEILLHYVVIILPVPMYLFIPCSCVVFCLWLAALQHSSFFLFLPYLSSTELILGGIIAAAITICYAIVIDKINVNWN